MNHLIKVEFEYNVGFLPTARSRKARIAKKRSHFYFPLLEVEESEFKKAFVVPVYDSRYEGGTVEYRSYKGVLYKPMLNPYNENYPALWTKEDCIRYATPSSYYHNLFLSDYEEMEEGSVILSDNKNERIASLLNEYMRSSTRKLMFNYTLWEVTKEPRYRVAFYNGFGSYHRPLIMVDSDGPFNANQFDLAVDYALKQSKGDGRVTREKLQEDTYRKIVVLDDTFVTEYKHEVAFMSDDPIEFGILLAEEAKLSIDGRLLFNISGLDEEYLSSLLFADGILTPLGSICMERRRLELVKDGNYFIARHKVDYFDLD